MATTVTASRYGSVPTIGTGRAFVGYGTQNAGNFGLSYLYLRPAGEEATRLASAYWKSKSLGRAASFNVSSNQNLDKRSERNLFVGFSWALDGRTHVGTGMRDNQRTNAHCRRAKLHAERGRCGWRAGTRFGDGEKGGQAEVNFLGRYGRVATGVNVFGDSRFMPMPPAGWW